MELNTKHKRNQYYKSYQNHPNLFKFSTNGSPSKLPTFISNMKKTSLLSINETQASDNLPVVDSTNEDKDNKEIAQLNRFQFKSQCPTFWSTHQKDFLTKNLQKNEKHCKSGKIEAQVTKSSSLSKNFSIQNFKFLRKIGNGTYGKVYLVEQRFTKILLAIKIISKQVVKQKETQQLIFRQIKIGFFLNHPNIAKLYSVFDDITNIYMIQQYLSEGDLYSLIKNKTYKDLNQKKVSNILKQLIQGLDYMHSKNIIHRDLKLQNIILSNGIVKICDFGCAIQSIELRTTKVGSLGYFSPQKLKDGFYGHKADIWSLGIICYELLFGKAPFDKDIVQILHNNDKNRQFSELIFPQKISSSLKDFLNKMLQKDPEKRITLSQAFKHPFIAKEIENQKKLFDLKTF